MTCPRTEDLSALIDHPLPTRQEAALQQHLGTCPMCRTQLDALQALRQQLQGLPTPTLGCDLAAQWQDRLAPRQPQHTGWGWRGGLPNWLADGLSHWLPTGLAASTALVSGVWLGGLLLGTGSVVTSPAPTLTRVFDPVPPGGLCTAAEICRLPRTQP